MVKILMKFKVILVVQLLIKKHSFKLHFQKDTAVVIKDYLHKFQSVVFYYIQQQYCYSYNNKKMT